ncbi:MAG: hypothetical protein H0U02_02585 [Rubrobacter sp.]|nr:hypothetical protein [Rubrobacter sp.]
MFPDAVTQMLPFLTLVALGAATLLVAFGALRSARRAEEGGESRHELLRDQAERLELLREERKTLIEELELERRERLQAQRRVEQLTREHPHLELERENQRITEELELEREGRLHNHRERQRLAEDLEEERLARSGDQRELERLRLEIRQQVEELERLWEIYGTSKGSKSLWGRLFGAKNR